MIRILTLLLFFLSASTLRAQVKAVTETGDEVILFQDGTWEYQDKENSPEKEIPTNPKDFTRPEDSSFLLKSKRLNLGFWIDPKKWSFQKGTENQDAEYEMELKEGDLYAMIITEKMEVPLQSLKAIAVENGRSVAPDLKVVKEEYRNVNGLKVLLLQMNGTMQGIKFTYYGYYFSSTNGSVQFITYTSQNLIDSFRPECEKLLNGLVELD